MCQELLGEATVQKVAHFPLLASTKARQIGKIAEDTEAQLLERINDSPRYIDYKATVLVCAVCFLGGCVCGYVMYPFVANHTTVAERFKSLITYQEN